MSRFGQVVRPLAGIRKTLVQFWFDEFSQLLNKLFIWLPTVRDSFLKHSACRCRWEFSESQQWPHFLPACYSQQQFLQRLSSGTAQSCCLEATGVPDFVSCGGVVGVAAFEGGRVILLRFLSAGVRKFSGGMAPENILTPADKVTKLYNMT